MTAERDHACSGKRRFTEFGAAQQEARRMRRSHQAPMHPYHCEHCNGYHTGTPSIGHLKRKRAEGVSNE